MCKNKNSITTNHLIYTLLVFFLFYPNSAIANNTQMHSDSIITLPIEANLSVLEDYLNDFIPDQLADLTEPYKVCLEPQYLTVKGVPKCKIDGFEISCNDRSVNIRSTPEIKCNLEGWIKRNGRIRISGQGNKITFTFPIKAEATADRFMKGTARGAAIISLDAIPRLNKDWSLSVDIEPDFVWSNKPTLKLFNLININIKSILEPKLRKKMEQFRQAVPKLLENLEIKEKVTEVWKDIQKPLKINDESEMYLLFHPKKASCSEFKIENNILYHTSSVEGQTQIILGKPPQDDNITALTDLELICHKKGEFKFHLPVLITYEELLTIVKKNFLDKYETTVIKSGMPGILKITNLKIGKSSEKRIKISAHLNYDNRSKWLQTIDIFDWFDVDGEITFNSVPRIEKQTRTLIFDHFMHDSNTNNDLFDLLVDITEVQPIQSYFESLIKYEFGPKVDESILKANKLLHQFSKDNLNVSGSVDILSVENITINEKDIMLYTTLSGILNLNVDF